MKQVVIRIFAVCCFVMFSAAWSLAAEQTAVFAGGCFWGVEAVFEHVKGVNSVVSGYSGGSKESADYETVSSGKTDHAESVMIKFDPDKVTYQQLLFIFFSVAHDPTQLNQQGPDHGRQYRSVIFYTSDDQKTQAEAFVAGRSSGTALPLWSDARAFALLSPATLTERTEPLYGRAPDARLPGGRLPEAAG